MSRRGVRLVVAAAALAWAAAALAALPPALPAGLAAACAPGRVLPELAAGAAAMVLLVIPSFTAAEPGRPAEDPSPLAAAVAAAPAAVALAAAAGRSPADLLPPGAVVLAAGLAAASYLRLDPAGRRSIPFAAGAAALLAALPVAAFGAAELGGWEGAKEAYLFSPLLAARASLEGGFGKAAPAALLLVGAAAAMRFARLLRGPATGTPPAAAGEGD